MSEREEHEWKALSPRSAPRFVARRLRSGDPETFYLSDGYALRSDFARDTEILRLASEVATLRAERDEAREIALTFGCVCGQPDDLCPTCEALDKLNARIASSEGEEPGR